MKEKILPFIIGFLVGAIIATTCFLIYSKSITNNDNNPQMNQNENMETPPEKMDGEMGTPPAKPEDSNDNQSNN